MTKYKLRFEVNATLKGSTMEEAEKSMDEFLKDIDVPYPLISNIVIYSEEVENVH